MVGPFVERGLPLGQVGCLVVDTGYTGPMPVDVAKNGLDNMRQHPEPVVHDGGHRSPQVVQPPICDRRSSPFEPSIEITLAAAPVLPAAVIAMPEDQIAEAAIPRADPPRLGGEDLLRAGELNGTWCTLRFLVRSLGNTIKAAVDVDLGPGASRLPRALAPVSISSLTIAPYWPRVRPAISRASSRRSEHALASPTFFRFVRGRRRDYFRRFPRARAT